MTFEMNNKQKVIWSCYTIIVFLIILITFIGYSPSGCNYLSGYKSYTNNHDIENSKLNVSIALGIVTPIPPSVETLPIWRTSVMCLFGYKSFYSLIWAFVILIPTLILNKLWKDKKAKMVHRKI